MDLISEINLKYKALEAEVDKKLDKVKRDEEKLSKEEKNIIDKSAVNNAIKKLSYEEAIERNVNLLKSLEMAKARLRSRSTFSPVEQILEKAIENYKRDITPAAIEADVEAIEIPHVSYSSSTDNENDYEVVKN